LLKKCQEFFSINKVPENGLILFAGINQYNKEIFDFFVPKIQLRQSYYYCGKSFQTDRFEYLFEEIYGWIIFANGDICHLYKFENKFIKMKTIDGNLISRQRKGGQSALRFSRLAEESRLVYIGRIVDSINMMCRGEKIVPIYIFGSKEILKMIFERKDLLVKLYDGGFLDFDNNTINNSNLWSSYLNQVNHDNMDMEVIQMIEEVILYLDTNVDMLDFDQDKKIEMKFFLTKETIERYGRNKHSNPEYYQRLKMFEYIGVKYYNA
jgi:hypothetical protein